MVPMTIESYLVVCSYWVSWKLVTNVYTSWIRGQTHAAQQQGFEEITALLWNPEMRLSLNDWQSIHWLLHFHGKLSPMQNVLITWEGAYLKCNFFYQKALLNNTISCMPLIIFIHLYICSLPWQKYRWYLMKLPSYDLQWCDKHLLWLKD